MAWGLGALGIALALLALRLAAPDAFLSLLAPAFAAGERASAWIGTVGKAAGVGARSLAAENEKLAAENAALALQNQALKEEVSDLAALIGTSTPRGRGIVAGVAARPPTAPYGTLVLAGGTDAGIAPGMEVFGAGGAPLGRVKAASARSSRVLLFSAPGVTTDAWAGDARIPLTLTGAGAGVFTASVPQGAGIALGDLVYVPGPGAVPLGRVAHVASTPSDPVAALSIASLINPFSITWVALYEAAEPAAP